MNHLQVHQRQIKTTLDATHVVTITPPEMGPHASLKCHFCEEQGHQARPDLGRWYVIRIRLRNSLDQRHAVAEAPKGVARAL